MKSRCVAAASSGVAQWNGCRIPSRAVGELVEERGPHLEDRVGEAELEDRAGDRRVRRDSSRGRSSATPARRPARSPSAAASSGASSCTRSSPRCRRSRSPRCSSRRARSASSRSAAGTSRRRLDLAEQHGVVPGVARHRLARPVRAARGRRWRGSRARSRGAQPARSGRWSACMPRSPMQPYSPFEARDPLPVDRLARVEVARVQEQRAHLDHAAEAAARAIQRATCLAARVEGQLRRAADEQLRVRAIARVDRVVRGEVDPERLLAEQVLPGLERRRRRPPRAGGAGRRSRRPRPRRRRAARGSRR